MANNVIAAPQQYAIQKPQPIQVSAPLANQVAASGMKPLQIIANQPSGYDRQASTQALESVRQGNLRAMSAFSGTIADKLKQKQEEEFAQGYLRHQQGESVATIAEEQPFGDLFGDGAAVRGARARQQENSGQALVQYVQQNQGDLSRMTLDEQRTAIAKFVSDLGTGDTQADVLIAQGAMKMMPAMLDNLARTAEAENQRTAAINQADGMKQGGDAMRYARSQFETGQMAPEHYEQLKANYLEQMQPLPGQSNASYRAALTGQLMQLSKDGSFEMASLVYDNVLSPQLTPEERQQMEGQMKTSQAQWQMENPVARDFTDFRVQMPAQIEAGTYTSQDDVESDIDRMNADYKVQTGSLSPLIDNKERAQHVARWMDYNQRQAAANAKLNQAALDEATKRGLYMDGMAKGSPSTMQAAGLDKPTQAAIESNQVNTFFEEDGNNAGMVIGRLAASGNTLAPLKEQVDQTMGMLKGGGIPKQENLEKMQLTYQKLMNTPFGIGAVDAYFGDDLPLVQSMMQMDMSDKASIQSLREQAASGKQRIQPSKDVQDAADKLVDDEVKPGMWSRWFGEGQQIGAGYEAQLKDEFRKEAAQLMAQYPNWSQENIMKTVVPRVLKGKDIAGNMVVTGSRPGQLIGKLNESLNIRIPDSKDTRINTIIHDGIKAKYPKDGSYEIGSLAMLPGGNNLYATVMRDGREQGVVLNIAEMAAAANATKVKDVAKDKERRKSYKLEEGMTEAYRVSQESKQNPMR